VSIASQFSDFPPPEQWIGAVADVEPRWYAVHTRAQHEKSVTSHLQNQGITAYLPVVTEVHRWSDRQKVVQMPLFSCYVFLHVPLVPATWAKVMRMKSILRFVGTGSAAVPIPDNQIESMQMLLSSKVPYAVHPFLKVGQRVRVRGGSLDGIEGILMSRNGNHNLVISIEPLQRSLSLCIDDYAIEPL
jgi:transcription termination/antitermination protein NusG